MEWLHRCDGVEKNLLEGVVRLAVYRHRVLAFKTGAESSRTEQGMAEPVLTHSDERGREELGVALGVVDGAAGLEYYTSDESRTKRLENQLT